MTTLLFKDEKRGEGEDGRQVLKVDVSKRIMSYLQDSSRHVQEPWFRVPEFVDWLFSRENQVWNIRNLKDSACGIEEWQSQKVLA